MRTTQTLARFGGVFFTGKAPSYSLENPGLNKSVLRFYSALMDWNLKALFKTNYGNINLLIFYIKNIYELINIF